MTNRERVKAVINKKSYDRLPVSFDVTTKAMEKICSRYRIKPSEFKGLINDNLDYIHIIEPENSPAKTENGTYFNEFGVGFKISGNAYEIGDWGGIAHSPLSGGDLKGYRFPQKDASRFRHWDSAAMSASDNYQIFSFTGIFDICWLLTGFENFMYYQAGEPEFAGELLDKALEYNLGLLETMPGGADGIRVGEDWGLQKGLIMGAKIWREQLKPRLKILYAAARKKGLDVFIHSCGDIAELFPDLIEIGVQVVNPCQPEAMDIQYLKREYGKDLVLYGGVSCQKTLPCGAPEDVRKECETLASVIGKNGGYIFGPSGGIPTDAKIENLVELIEFTKRI